jgi:hypothetical protein
MDDNAFLFSCFPISTLQRAYPYQEAFRLKPRHKRAEGVLNRNKKNVPIAPGLRALVYTP